MRCGGLRFRKKSQEDSGSLERRNKGEGWIPQISVGKKTPQPSAVPYKKGGGDYTFGATLHRLNIEWNWAAIRP